MTDICSICREIFDDNHQIYYLPECNHLFHTECILHWFRYGRQSCPLCNNNGGAYNGANGVYTSRLIKITHLRRYSLSKECPPFIKQQFKLLRKHETRDKELRRLYKTKFNEFMGTAKEFKQMERERDNKLRKIDRKIRTQKHIICETPLEMVIIVNRIQSPLPPPPPLPSPVLNQS